MQDAADLAVAAQLDKDALGEAEPEEIEGLVDARGGGHNTSSALVAEIQKGAFGPRVRSFPESFRSKSGQSQDNDFHRGSPSHTHTLDKLDQMGRRACSSSDLSTSFTTQLYRKEERRRKSARETHSMLETDQKAADSIT
jgi:hypothetical protein